MKLVRKSSYLLLELMIAFVLVGGVALFLIYNPLQFVGREMKMLREMEMQRVADVAYAEMKVKLHSSRETVAHSKKNAKRHYQPIKIGTDSFYLYEQVWIDAEEKDKDQNRLMRVKMEMGFTRKDKQSEKPIKKFSYTAFVEHSSNRI